MPLPIEELPPDDQEPLREDRERLPLGEPEPEDEDPDHVEWLPLFVPESVGLCGVVTMGAVVMGALQPEPDGVSSDQPVRLEPYIGLVGPGLDICPWDQLLGHISMPAAPAASRDEGQVLEVPFHEGDQDRVVPADADLTVVTGAGCPAVAATIGAVTMAAVARPAAILVSRFQVCGCVRTTGVC